jgi:hypothetical protein
MWPSAASFNHYHRLKEVETRCFQGALVKCSASSLTTLSALETVSTIHYWENCRFKSWHCDCFQNFENQCGWWRVYSFLKFLSKLRRQRCSNFQFFQKSKGAIEVSCRTFSSHSSTKQCWSWSFQESRRHYLLSDDDLFIVEVTSCLNSWWTQFNLYLEPCSTGK